MNTGKTNYRRSLSLLTQKSVKNPTLIKITFTQTSNESGNVQTTMIYEKITSNQEPIP